MISFLVGGVWIKKKRMFGKRRDLFLIDAKP
jgi:hypothetical protein